MENALMRWDSVDEENESRDLLLLIHCEPG